MKKQILKGLLLLSAFMFTTNLKAQWTEGFPTINMPTGWDIIDSGGSETWKFNNSGNPTGYAFIAYNSGAVHDDYLITKQFMVTDGVSDFFEFQAASLDAPNFTDDFFVEISTTGKAISDFTPISAQLSTSTSTFQDYAYDLSAYEGQDVYIAFHAVSLSASGKQGNLMIDNVEVSAAPTCSQPSALSVSNVTSTNADLAWTENGGATAWDIEYGPTGFTQSSANGTVVFAVSNPHVLTILPDTEYQFYVRADCGSGLKSPWVGPFDFSNTYCDFTFSTSDTPSHIESFSTINAVSNISNLNSGAGTPTAGYTDFSSMVMEAFPAQEVDFEISTSSTASHGVSIFVDWNNDFIFDASEKVYNSGGYVSMPHSASFSVPAGTNLGEYRMRVVADKNLPTGGACSGSSAEAEDYTIEVVDVPACIPPSILNVANLTFTSGELAWTENGSSSTWNIEYGIAGFTTGAGTMETGVTTNPFPVTGLTDGTAYDFYVQSDCGTEQSVWAGPFTFTTPIECLAPTDLSVIDVGYDTSVVTWTANGTGTNWIIEYGTSGFTPGSGTEIQTTDNSYTLTGLSLSTDYDVYVWTDCGSSTISDLVGPVTFTSGNCNTSGVDVDYTICKNEPVDLDTLRTQGSHADGTWLDTGDNTLTSTDITVSGIAGIYTYTYITSSDDCPIDTAYISITVDDACDYLSVMNEALTDVSVYPNPSNNLLNIVNPSNTSSLKVEMVDMNGRVVLVENKALHNATEATLAIDHLEKGIYTLRVYNNEGQKTFKIVKQ